MFVGQCVVIKDDKYKILYEICNINNGIAIIKGINYRVIKKTPLDSLEIANVIDIQREKDKTEKYYYKLINQKFRQERKYILGTILHIDGDNTYLKKCLELYESLGIFAYGVRVSEEKMEDEVKKVLNQIRPDIVVVTGHDSYNAQGLVDLDNYTNTVHFMNTVKVIKRHDSNICVIAGACQSNFEALMACGASFASSPKRINIHTFDPAVIAIKVSTTSFMKLVDFIDIIKFIEDGRKAYGGVETYGKMRMLV